MKTNILLILYSLIVSVGCNIKNAPSNESTSDKDSIKAINSITPRSTHTFNKDKKINSNSNLSCDSLLTLLVRSSSIDSSLKRFKIKAQNFNNNTLTISITNTNELGHNTPIAWLKLDTATLHLSDVTIDPDHPKELHYDTTLYWILLKKCLR